MPRTTAQDGNGENVPLAHLPLTAVRRHGRASEFLTMRGRSRVRLFGIPGIVCIDATRRAAPRTDEGSTEWQARTANDASW